jgi:glucose/arabinose dehydrogenase
VIGWPQGKTPVAPEGFTVTKFAGDLVNPRNIYVAQNGDIFVAEANTEAKGVDKVKKEASSEKSVGDRYAPMAAGRSVRAAREPDAG